MSTSTPDPTGSGEEASTKRLAEAAERYAVAQKEATGPEPYVYYQDAAVTLWCGRMEDVLPALDMRFDAAIVDPPYGATRLVWDRWNRDILRHVADVTHSMWCFGSAKMFGEHWNDFTQVGWKFSHDVVGADESGVPIHDDVVQVWEKTNGSRPVRDRLLPVHEFAYHWYQGRWSDIYRQVPRVPATGGHQGGPLRGRSQPAHIGAIDSAGWIDDGTRLTRSVIRVPGVQRGISRTQKPEAVVAPLIEYAVPPGGVVIDATAGSCTTGVVARKLGRYAVLVEKDEEQCRLGAARLANTDLFTGSAS